MSSTLCEEFRGIDVSSPFGCKYARLNRCSLFHWLLVPFRFAVLTKNADITNGVVTAVSKQLEMNDFQVSCCPALHTASIRFVQQLFSGEVFCKTEALGALFVRRFVYLRPVPSSVLLKVELPGKVGVKVVRSVNSGGCFKEEWFECLRIRVTSTLRRLSLVLSNLHSFPFRLRHLCVVAVIALAVTLTLCGCSAFVSQFSALPNQGLVLVVVIAAVSVKSYAACFRRTRVTHSCIDEELCAFVAH
jgi:hypothetical protein